MLSIIVCGKNPYINKEDTTTNRSPSRNIEK